MPKRGKVFTTEEVKERLNKWLKESVCYKDVLS